MITKKQKKNIQELNNKARTMLEQWSGFIEKYSFVQCYYCEMAISTDMNSKVNSTVCVA